MNRQILQPGLLAVLTCLLGLCGGSYAPLLASLTPPKVPDSLKVPPGEVLRLRAQARGVQIYQCQSKADNPRQFEWTLKAPEADLFNDKNQKIGKHYPGPTWEANDGSKVVGQLKARANAPDNSAIPWLLLTAKSHEGNGIFSQITSIQRVDTVGGIAPATGCDQSHQKAQVPVNYQANYYLYSAAGT